MRNDEMSKTIDTGLVAYVENLDNKRAEEVEGGRDVLDQLWVSFFQYFKIMPSTTKPARKIDNSKKSG